MKVTQYITDQTLQCAAYSLQPALEMPAAHTVTVGENSVNDSFQGFGVAVTGSSCYNLNLMEPNARRDFLKSIYSDEGLGLSVARLSVGSSDYSAELYSYDDVENDTALEHFSIERDKDYIIPMIREILAIRPDLYIYASPWSPPGWMKTGGKMCGGFMRREYLDCYADYLIRFVEEYAKCGIKISALTVQNETLTSQEGRMPACIWHPDLEAEFVVILRKKLDEKHLDVKIWFHDHNFNDTGKVLWCLENHKDFADACDGIAFHYYSGAIEETEPLRQKYPLLPCHFTEGGPRLYDNYGTDWCKWVAMMSKVLYYGFSSFTGWNLILDEKGGPNIGPYFCGGLATLNRDGMELSYSGQYKAFRQIAPFMQKGARIYPAQVGKQFQGIFGFPRQALPQAACMIENPDGSQVLIATNPNKDKRQMQYFFNGEWWYFEMMPDSVSTVVFEK